MLPHDKLASGSQDDIVRIWSTKSGGLLHQLHGHSDTVRSLSLLSDQKTLASASADKTIKLWDTETGELMRENILIRF